VWDIPITQATSETSSGEISLRIDAAEMVELLIHEIYGNEEYRDETTVECCAMMCFAKSNGRTNELSMQDLSPTKQFIINGRKRSAQVGLNMSSTMPVNIQIMPDSNKPLSKAALEKQYEKLCAQINAYHVAGSPSTVRTPIFDTGCTDHLFSADVTHT
jgi:hypothetical protein